jgi:predicted ArsR family transcriptional regulator
VDETEGDRSSVPRQARALGDETRYRIFRYIADAAEPARVADLSAHLGLNPTGIRHHLAKLCAAGLLVDEQAVPTGPGRPPRQYRLSLAAAGRWSGHGPYEELSISLLRMREADSSAREAGVAAGRQLTAEAPSGDAVDVLEREMARRGFQPSRIQRGSTTELVLGRCSLAEAASVDPDVVCEIHRGVVEGILEASDSRFELTGLTRQPPRNGGCCLRVERGGE